MEMSKAALPPRQPYISAKDREHPLFPVYDRYRVGMSAQLVEASSFADWLYQYERDERESGFRNHPRLKEFQDYLADHFRATGHSKTGCPPGDFFPNNFAFWLEGGRW